MFDSNCVIFRNNAFKDMFPDSFSILFSIQMWYKSQRVIVVCVVLLLFYTLRQEKGLNVAGTGSCNIFFPQFEGAFKK